jgi:hypothetical protein
MRELLIFRQYGALERYVEVAHGRYEIMLFLLPENSEFSHLKAVKIAFF